MRRKKKGEGREGEKKYKKYASTMTDHLILFNL